MLTGKLLRLNRATVALQTIQGIRRVMTVPEGAILKVVAEACATPEATVDVLWEGKTVQMFSVDVETRGMELVDQKSVSQGA